MAKPFNGKVVFITGAASGIGKATAIQLAKQGAFLILTDISPAVHRNPAVITSSDAVTATLDVSDEDAVRKCIEEVLVKTDGRLDHVFNCAGINPTAYPLTDAPPDYFDKLVGTNLKGVYNVTRHAIPYLKPHNGCTITNVSSVLGVRPGKEMAIYCATKYAVVGFTKAMALELGEQRIRVNAVAPGYIDTPTNASVVMGRKEMTEASKSVALGRMGTADEVAEVVVFLMSDAARYVNGAVWGVDGGR
jgi:NAD(P)-dependent dehydrogenase (short-subunit alcohol dehydrogenase family)